MERNTHAGQIWVPMSYYLLLTYIMYQTKDPHPLLNLSRVMRETLFDQKALVDIQTFRPERLRDVKDEPLQGTLF